MKQEISEIETNVFLFKNGKGFISNTVPVTKKLTKKIFNELPKDILIGTLQYLGDNNCTVKKVSTQNVIGESKKLATNITEILLANIERELEIGLKDKTITVKLIDIPTKFPENDKIGQITIGEVAIFQDLKLSSYYVINLKDIRSVSTLSSDPINAEFLQKENVCSHIVEYELNENRETANIYQRYMTSGITFCMKYNIDLKDEKEISLSANAVILNDVQDLNCTNLNCIAGFPNINFSRVDDPFTKKDKVEQFINSLDSMGSSSLSSLSSNKGNSMLTQNRMSNIMTNNNVFTHVIQDDEKLDLNGGSNSDDLHLYKFQNIFLKKNERVSVPLFTETFKYKDIYHCKISDRNLYSNPETKIEDVWHAIELSNTTNQPWTTGTVLVTKQHQFVCNNQLNFTPVGGKVRIDITKALLVLAIFEESSPKIIKNEERIGEIRYSLMSATGKIKVSNNIKEDINIIVSVKLTGELKDMGISPVTQKDCSNHRDVNVTKNVEWSLDVKSGQSKEITYTRTYYYR